MPLALPCNSPVKSSLATSSGAWETECTASSSTQLTLSEESYSSLNDSFSHKHKAVVVQEVAPVANRHVRFVRKHINQAHECPWILLGSVNGDAQASSDIDSMDSASSDTSADNHITTNDENFNGPMLVDTSSLWYNEKDIRGFRQYVQKFARFVEEREKMKIQNIEHKQAREGCKGSNRITNNDEIRHTWSTCLWNVYKAFHKVSDMEEIQAIIDSSTTCHVNAYRVGLDRWAMSSLKPVRRGARQAMYRAIDKLQTTATTMGACPEITAVVIRRACRDITRPSRMYATYIGHMGLAEYHGASAWFYIISLTKIFFKR